MKRGAMETKCVEAGKFAPVVDYNRCEAKGPCVAACPYDVFEIRRIEPADYAKLSFLGKIKSKVHGGIAAYAVNAEKCRACGLCVRYCPESAIKLIALA